MIKTDKPTHLHTPCQSLKGVSGTVFGFEPPPSCHRTSPKTWKILTLPGDVIILEEAAVRLTSLFSQTYLFRFVTDLFTCGSTAMLCAFCASLNRTLKPRFLSSLQSQGLVAEVVVPLLSMQQSVLLCIRFSQNHTITHSFPFTKKTAELFFCAFAAQSSTVGAPPPFFPSPLPSPFHRHHHHLFHHHGP